MIFLYRQFLYLQKSAICVIVKVNWMGIWFGAVESLIISGANICEHILSVVIPTTKSLYLHCILIHPDKFSRGAVRYTTGEFHQRRTESLRL